MGGVRFKIFTQPNDKVIQSACFCIAAVPPDGAEQFGAMNGTPLFLEEKRQYPHLHLGKVNLSLSRPCPVRKQKHLVVTKAVPLLNRLRPVP